MLMLRSPVRYKLKPLTMLVFAASAFLSLCVWIGLIQIAKYLWNCL